MIMQIQQFLLMGGYGEYVWTAYGLVAVVLLGLLWRELRGFKMVSNKCIADENSG